jgi:FixJ family two-component response regulator
VISDVQLPKLDGLGLQAQLQAKGNMVPIIFITAYPNPAMEARAKKAGAVAVLHKPFDGEALVDYLNAALKRGSEGGAKR